MKRLFSKRLANPAFLGLLLLATVLLVASCREEPLDRSWPPRLHAASDTAPVLRPSEALKTFFLPPGYRMELVASEPLVQDPVAIDMDPDGRLWVVEMRGYMPDIEGEGEEAPVGRIVVLEDDDDDGRMDRSTVYLDSLVLPRAVKVLESGVLVGAPPYLWLTRDVDGDLRADEREVVRDDYGNPEVNPEHNANGLVWGLDNWIHSAKYDGLLRQRAGRWAHILTREVGQWGLSFDDYGRFYRNYNEDPLHVDLLPAHYFARNPHLTRTRGVYETTEAEETVWPVHPTPGVNRGYRENILREDGTLHRFTSAGSPVVYRGDRLPEALRNNVFITEPAGNLVRRFVLTEDADGTLTARNAYEEAEFLASTDERFRPVNLYSAPDGTLYVIDMYRGIIQHRRYVTGYLSEQIRARGLERPLGLGRIYRIVHTTTERDEKPQLSSKTSAELVAYLAHPNGWWRDTAQRLLVERGDRSAVPALRTLACTAEDARTRLHALWTLEGLDGADGPTLTRVLSDEAPYVRAAAIRVAEPFLASGDPVLRVAVMERADDPHPAVRRQLAATLGTLPPADREDALAALLTQHGDDPIVVDAALSGLYGRELAFLERLLDEKTTDGEPAHLKDAVQMLAAAVIKTDDADPMQRMLALAGQEGRPRWQRLALLDGVATFAPDPGNPEGQRLTLDRKPAGLLAATVSEDRLVRGRAEALAGVLDWPGKPSDTPHLPPLSPAEQERFDAGKVEFLATCAPCHQPDGRGLPGVAKKLVGSKWVLGSPNRLIRIVLHGKEGEMLMPPMHALSDDQIAAILTYIRREWGNQASPVEAGQVREIRGQYAGRTEPWTEEELSKMDR